MQTYLILSLTLTLVSIFLAPLRDANASSNDVEIEIEVAEKIPSRVAGPISKPPTDHREYKGIILANEMKVMLISDPTTSKSAASLCVAVGSMYDPPELPGLAHFTEHLLFLGNQKFPKENEFQKFITEHGGSIPNAVTQSDETYYFFSVAPASLKDSLERYYLYFEREVNAVNSEHEKNINDERRRMQRIETLTVKKGHPYAQFRTGTSETLWTKPRANSTDIREAVLNFYGKYYSSNLMNLAILGSESLDELQKMVEEIFLDVPNRNSSLPVQNESPYGVDELQERVEMVPLADWQSLLVIFPINYIKEYYVTTAAGYLGHMIGQEGPGSMAAFLKSKHWADFVSAGTDIHARGFTNFAIKISLTQQGFENLDNVVLHIFEYVKLLKDLGPQEWFWEEVRDIKNLGFRFRDELHPLDLARKLSVQLIRYPMEGILHAEGVPSISEYDPQVITETLDLLTPQNCRLIVTSKSFENSTEEIEEFYGVHYSRKKIPTELIEMWSNADLNPVFHLPQPNEFIPTEFDLKQRDNDSMEAGTPRILNYSALSQIWFLQDNEFRLPKANLRLEMMTPIPNQDPEKFGLNQLLAKIIEESLWEFQYNGNLAGLDSRVMGVAYGITIAIEGYDHKLATFEGRIIDKIVDFSTDLQQFERIKASHIRSTKLKRDIQPCHYADNVLRQYLWDGHWSDQELIEALQDVTIEDLYAYAKDFIKRLKFRWVFYGNLTPEEALKMANESQNKFIETNATKALFPSQLDHMRTVEIPQGSSYLVKLIQTSHHLSTCSAMMFQLGIADTRSYVLGYLMSHIAAHSFYDQLRTKEQLGYTVMVTPRYEYDLTMSTHYVKFLVQGNYSPPYVESRIDTVIAEIGEELKNMTAEKFEKHTKSLRYSDVKTMDNRMRLIVREIQSEQLNFNRREDELAVLTNLTLPDLQEYFEENVLKKETRRRLVVRVFSNNGNGDSSDHGNFTLTPSEEILDPISWKRKMKLFPSSI